MRIKDQIKKILDNGFPFTEKERFLLEYMELVVLFRLAVIDERNSISNSYSAITKMEKISHIFGFSLEDLGEVHRYFIGRDEYELQEISKKITAKKGKKRQKKAKKGGRRIKTDYHPLPFIATALIV